MTGRLGAVATYSVVDEFLRLASTTLTRHGAFIDKYIGDAVMAFLNVPIKRTDHAAAVVTAAARLQEPLPGQRRIRRDCIARLSCLEMTPQERRQVRFAVGLAAASLVLIGLEILMHYLIDHPLVRRPFL